MCRLLEVATLPCSSQRTCEVLGKFGVLVGSLKSLFGRVFPQYGLLGTWHEACVSRAPLAPGDGSEGATLAYLGWCGRKTP